MDNQIIDRLDILGKRMELFSKVMLDLEAFRSLTKLVAAVCGCLAIAVLWGFDWLSVKTLAATVLGYAAIHFAGYLVRECYTGEMLKRINKEFPKP